MPSLPGAVTSTYACISSLPLRMPVYLPVVCALSPDTQTHVTTRSCAPNSHHAPPPERRQPNRKSCIGGGLETSRRAERIGSNPFHYRYRRRGQIARPRVPEPGGLMGHPTQPASRTPGVGSARKADRRRHAPFVALPPSPTRRPDRKRPRLGDDVGAWVGGCRVGGMSERRRGG